ncbi:MAG TPA: TlpA disulfide reductase family protein [Burkholderiaceae bacterium]|nr:TlpA disulfide reductase family protein [Burkholderiaceae bacterium]
MSDATRRDRRRVLTVLAATLGVLAGGWFAARRFGVEPANDTAVTDLLALRLPDAQAREIALADFGGKWLVLNFWATWCAPCVDEMPELSAMARELEGTDIQVLGIGIDSARNIGEFASRHHITYPLLVSGPGGVELLRRFGNAAGGLPFTVLVAPDGRIIERILGRVDIRRLKQQALKAAGRA